MLTNKASTVMFMATLTLLLLTKTSSAAANANNAPSTTAAGPNAEPLSVHTSMPMTDEFRSAVVNKHNAYRTLTASGQTPGMPKASNMIQLAWDPALERIAANHVSRCVRSGTRNLPKKYFESADRAMQNYQTTTAIGQLQFYTNEATILSWPERAMVAAVEKFYSGYENYSWATNKCDRLSRCRDYKQVVWSTTRYVGCAYNPCGSLSLRGEGRVSDAVFVTCYYVRSAWGGRPYRTRMDEATPCGDCPSDMSQCTNELCSGNALATIQGPPVSQRPTTSCSVMAYQVYTTETNRLLSVANSARDEADACANAIGVTPTLEICSGMSSPPGCFNCLQKVDEADRALDAAMAMDNRKMNMKEACTNLVILPEHIRAGSCVESLWVDSAPDAVELDMFGEETLRGCKSKCGRDTGCGCFVFNGGLCFLYGSHTDCTIVPNWDVSDGGFCVH